MIHIQSIEDMQTLSIDSSKHRFPFCIVWTPIPILTWLLPVIGHMGITLSSGVIRDFAGPYYVSEDNMAFGWPTKYWELQPALARGDVSGWDAAVTEASEIYKGRMHNLCCDNCHSHVATALNLMRLHQNLDSIHNFDIIHYTYYMFTVINKVIFFFLQQILLIFFKCLYNVT
ncbi:hypothetical protein JTB14_026814 [Gonioctena quinquepunctata]|nr:hypothetical protein JTB14_026814 [Gonioctena quinquepunctata]